MLLTPVDQGRRCRLLSLYTWSKHQCWVIIAEWVGDFGLLGEPYHDIWVICSWTGCGMDKDNDDIGYGCRVRSLFSSLTILMTSAIGLLGPVELRATKSCRGIWSERVREKERERQRALEQERQRQRQHYRNERQRDREKAESVCAWEREREREREREKSEPKSREKKTCEHCQQAGTTLNLNWNNSDDNRRCPSPHIDMAVDAHAHNFIWNFEFMIFLTDPDVLGEPMAQMMLFFRHRRDSSHMVGEFYDQSFLFQQCTSVILSANMHLLIYLPDEFCLSITTVR